MALAILQATAATTPNTGGDAAVSSPTVTGHASTVAFSSGEAFADNRSCRWSGFPAGPSSRLTATLKVTHTSDGSLTNPGATAANGFLLEYSLNNGGAWTTIVSRSNYSGSQGPTTFSLALGAGQDLTQVQVRDRLTTSSNDINDSASATVTIADIKIEVSTSDLPPVWIG